MNRSFVSALLSLACLSTLPVLAQATGSTQPDVTLSVPGNPTASGVSLTGTVVPPMPSTPAPVPHPTGTVTLLDGTTVLNPGGTALTANPAVSSQTFAQVFGTPDAITVNPLASWTDVVGDFNGDGIPDLLIYSTDSVSNTLLLQVFASSPGGKFAALPKQSLPMSSLSYYPTNALLDVDGDGHLDLLLGDEVVYGNGDGTFSRVAVLPVLATGFNQTSAVDMNGDGKLDIVAVNTPPTPTDSPGTVQYMFTVFRNDGSGTFTSLGSFPLAPSFQTGVGLCCAIYGIGPLGFADLNGDGKVDVISQSNWVPEGNAGEPTLFNVMLNNGDGSFGAPKSVDTDPVYPYSVSEAFGDINGDGKQDLVLAYATNEGLNYLGAALGNGDGTFGAFSQLKLIDFLTNAIPYPQVQLIDFNADGKLDAVLGSGELALGNGDGTFSLGTPLFPQPADPQTPLNYPLLQANLFPDSWPSFVYLNFTSGANAVFTPQDSSGATVNAALSVGTHTLTAQYSGDSVYAAGVSPAVTINVAPPVTTMVLTSSANPIYATQSVTFTATLNNPAATGTITFTDAYPGSNPLQPILNPSATTLGTATVANGVATLTTTQLPAGLHTITAIYGDVNNPTAMAQIMENVNLPFSVANSASQISLSTTPGGSASAQISISALGGFTGPVTFGCTNSPAVCSFSPATVNLAGTSASAVTLTVTATRAPTTAQVSPNFSETVLACSIPLFALFGIASGGIASRRRQRVLFAVIAIAFCGAFCLGCGGGGSQKTSPNSLPAGNYPFYVTAASGQNEQVLTGLLTVQ